jgi:hypothetical protein
VPLTDDQLDAVTGGLLLEGADPYYKCKSCDYMFDFDTQWSNHILLNPTHVR